MLRRRLLLFLLLVASCDRHRWRSAKREESAGSPVDVAAAAAPSGAPRIVAIGDLHGDLDATRAALRLAGAIDADDRWIGGTLVVVQTGDQIDRGGGERAILRLFDRLARDAARTGGAVISLNGNHELMNAAGDFRYVSPAGYADFGGEDARRAAFAPGGPLALVLAGRPLYAIVGASLFVHGGVLPEHLAGGGLAALDADARAWLRGDRAELPAALIDPDSPIWTRRYADLPAPDCAAAGAVLDRLHLTRMVVAHTVQPAGISAACNGRLWRIDVGLAAIYGGPLQVLEISDGDAHILSP